MPTHPRRPLAALALLAAATCAHAGLMDSLKEQAAGYAGSAMPALGSNSIGSVAGVLQYCVRNNYLGSDATSMKDKLMAKFTGQKPQQAGYASGAKGLLQGSDGRTLNLKGLSGKLKEKACDYVLENAGSLL